jgi:hypothetical protein
MSEISEVIPSQKDFEVCRVKIIKLIRDSEKPPSIQEVSNFLQRPLAIVKIYSDRLLNSGTINYIPTVAGGWGFVLPENG